MPCRATMVFSLLVTLSYWQAGEKGKASITMTMLQLNPTITFIVTMPKDEELPVEQLNTLFKFSEKNDRFCEILVVTDELEESRVRVVWLTLKLNQITHPHVRTRMIRCTSPEGLAETAKTAMNITTGQTIIVTSDTQKLAEKTAAQNGKKRKH